MGRGRATGRAKRWALVTGCSSGVGRATAHALRAQGWCVAAACRAEADCVRRRAEGFLSPRIDHGGLETVAAAVAEAETAAGGALDAVVANAAIASAGPLEDVTGEALAALFEVNVIGAQALVAAAYPAMAARGAGRIVFVSSILGVDCLAHLGAYQMSKHALEGVATSLRDRARRDRVDVTVVRPGPIATRITSNARAHVARFRPADADAARPDVWREIDRRLAPDAPASPAPFERPPEAAARRIARALDRRRAPEIVHVGPVAHALAATAVLPLRLRDRLRRALSE